MSDYDRDANGGLSGPGEQPGIRRGLTLIELLVVLLLTTVVTGVAFTLYRGASSNYLREDAYIQQQQNIRAATYLLSRDLKASGNGVAVVGPGIQRIQAYVPSQIKVSGGVTSIETTDGWFRYPDAPTSEPGMMAVFGTDGGANRPDTLTIFRTEIEYPMALGQIQSHSGNTITISDTIKGGTLAAGDIIAVINNNEAFLLESLTSCPLGSAISAINYKKPDGRFTDSSGPPSGFDLDGAYVYNLRDVSIITYYVDETENRLMAAIHDQRMDSANSVNESVVLANNIEDFQCYYFFEGDALDLTQVNNNPDIGYEEFKSKPVVAVAIGLTARSAYGGNSKGINLRPALFNRVAGTVPDNRRRSTIMELVTLRNSGF
jgi:prepilin-type N-terminal cleavage/methylation domain-containing protein